MITLTTNAIEESTYIIVCSFYDEEGATYIPVSVTWKLTDSAGNVINSRSAVSVTPAATVNIVLSGDDLAIATADRKRIVYIYGTYNSTYGTGLYYKDEIVFYIDNLVNVS